MSRPAPPRPARSRIEPIATLLLALAAQALLAGCLQREETIHVHPDGRVDLEVTVRADQPRELANGFSPGEAAGWSVTRSAERNEKGEASKHAVHATRTVPAGAPLPGHGGDPAAPDAALFVRYPTDVTVEQRDDGTWYHFRRVYEARTHAPIERIEKREGHERIKKITERASGEITDDQWRTVIEFFGRTEALKRLHHGREALLATTPDLPQDRWLRVHEAVISAVNELDSAALIPLLGQAKEGGQAVTEKIEQRARRFERRIDQRIVATLREAAGYDDGRVRAFREAYERERRRQAITSAFGWHRHTVRVKLPGEIVGANTDDRAADGTLTWSFTGDRAFDAPLELMASSRVTRPESGAAK